MLCVTGFEPSAAAFHKRAAAAPDCMHELRLDAMADPVAALQACGELPANTIVCWRAARQGGHFRGDDAGRIALLRQAARQGAAWLDAEADCEQALLDSLPRERLLLSWHDFEQGDADTIAAAIERMAGRSAGYKLAVTVNDAAQLHALLDVQPNGHAVLLAMGAAGLLSRCRPRAFGSAWSYVAANGGQTTAAGQLTLEQARQWGLPGSQAYPLLTLMGGAQVMGSPGPAVYNPMLAQLDCAHQYLPLVTADLATSLALLRRVGGVGASVTMPLKRDALRLGAADPLAQQVGAANTLVWRAQGAKAPGWHAFNSDVAGVALPLQRAFKGLSAPPQRALVLGAGGAARAAVVALQQLGLAVGMAVREPTKGRALGLDGVQWVPFEERATTPHEVLINATPIGGERSPWQGPVSAQVVLDMSLQRRSLLLQQARAAGAYAIDGFSMWRSQGAVQMSHLLDRPIAESLLETFMP